MHLIVQTYSLIELQQLRSELEKRGIRVHVSDEFTYAIPGMPGAEQPRGLWIALPEDIVPARQVVTDLVGADRLEPDQQGHPNDTDQPSVSAPADAGSIGETQSRGRSGSAWQWLVLLAALAIIWLLNG